MALIPALKKTAWFFVILLLLLAALWMSLPWWGQSVAQSVLPSSVALSDLELQRPGVTAIRIPHFALSAGKIKFSGSQLIHHYHSGLTQLKQLQIKLAPGDDSTPANKKELLRSLANQLKRAPQLIEKILVKETQGEVEQIDIIGKGWQQSLHHIRWQIQPKQASLTLHLCLSSKTDSHKCVQFELSGKANEHYQLTARESRLATTGKPWLLLDIKKNHLHLQKLDVLPWLMPLVANDLLPAKTEGSMTMSGTVYNDNHHAGREPVLPLDFNIGLQVPGHVLSHLMAPIADQLSVNIDPLLQTLETSSQLKISSRLSSDNLFDEGIKLSVTTSLRNPSSGQEAPVANASGSRLKLANPKVSSRSLPKKLNLSVQSAFTISDDWARLSLQHFSARVRAAEFDFELPATENNQIFVENKSPIQLSAELKTSSPVNFAFDKTHLITATPEMVSLQITGRGKSKLSNQPQQVDAAFDWAITAMPQLDLKTASIRSIRNFALTIDHLRANQQEKRINGSLSLTLDSVNPDLSEISGHWLSDLTLALDHEQSKSFQTRVSAQIVPSKRPPQHKITGEVSIDNLLTLPFDGQWQISGNNPSQHKLALSLSKSWTTAELNPLIHHFKATSDLADLDVNLNQGHAQLSADIKIQPQLSISASLTGQSLALQVEENKLTGIDFQQQLTWPAQQLSSGEFKTQSIQFGSGLTLDNVSLKNQFDQDLTLKIEQLRAQLFDGLLLAPSLQWDKRGLSPTQIQLNNIDLTALVFFLDVDGLYADGRLNATFPLRSQDDAIIVENAILKASDGGTIKYVTGKPVTADDLALFAMQNFQYTALDGTLDYLADGSYPMHIHLQGANPDLYNGYPIDFSLNIQGTLPGAFRALFLTGNFEEAVTRMINQNEQIKH